MCNQTNYHYLCGHITCGSLIPCANPEPSPHHTNYTPTSYSTLCPACSFTVLKSPLLLPVLSHATAAASLPSVSTPGHVIPPQQPIIAPVHSSGIITPGNVPPWIPREVRYEMIRGKLEAVEHFQGADIGIGVGGKRGYNIHHGWDDGALPPGFRVGRAAVDDNISGAAGEALKEICEAPVEVLSASDGAGHRLENSGSGS